MPLRIFNNLSSTVAQNRLSINNDNLGLVIGRIASGNRLSGKDVNSAERSVSELLRSDARTLRQATKNLNDGISLINVAEGGLNEQTSILTRLREVLSVAGGAIDQNTRGTLQLEINTLKDEFNRIATGTDFIGLKLLDGTLGRSVTTSKQITISTGLNSDEESQLNLNKLVDIESTDTSSLGLDGISTSSFEKSVDSLAQVEAAQETILGYRASIGATQNRLVRALATLNVSVENLYAANSVISDADIAEEVANLTKQQLLVQSSAAMVGQANLIPEGVLLLLQQ
ncbi:MAG: flagellin FliC [Nitrospina sp.]|jgi:flagellin|nr:flagellin FliC [Nitrospina sp.]MBT3875912.1 flagellin FliC [Nitrospina sp.]MBT4046953.1 flagellin FliC [Nitrospina sp.]MBT4557327.1 flagellin FliC [Nitrospina sp.]MBT5347599.1 flagellin FliC [Nitrospina sp.]